MRKLYACVKKFISNRYRLSLFFVISIMFVSGIAAIYSTLQNLLFWPFGFSICALFRLITYKKGKNSNFYDRLYAQKLRVEIFQ